MKIIFFKYLRRNSYQLDSFSDPYCYKTLTNHFHKSTNAIKKIISINSKININQFQRDELYAVYLLSNILSINDQPPLKNDLFESS